MAVNFRYQSFKPFKLFPLRSDADSNSFSLELSTLGMRDPKSKEPKPHTPDCRRTWCLSRWTGCPKCTSTRGPLQGFAQVDKLTFWMPVDYPLPGYQNNLFIARANPSTLWRKKTQPLTHDRRHTWCL